MDGDKMGATIALPTRQYSGRSHTIIVLGPVALGFIIGAVLVPFGPFAWWVNYLAYGALWGITKPARVFVRSALKYTTLEFRSSGTSWGECMKGTYREERRAWRTEPGNMVVATLLFTIGDAIAWPVATWMMAFIEGTVDHG